MVAVRSLVFFPHAHRVAVRTTGVIEPRPVVESSRLGDERIVIRPAADGIAPPPRFVELFGKLPAVGPDRAPFLVELVQNHDVLRRLDDPARSEIVKNDAREALRIAPRHRIVGQRGWHHRHPERRLVGQKRCPAFSGVRQLVLRLSIGGHLLRAIRVDAGSSARGWLPDAGNIPAWRGRRLFTFEVEIVLRTGLPDFTLTDRHPRNHQQRGNRSGGTQRTHQRHDTLLHDKRSSVSADDSLRARRGGFVPAAANRAQYVPIGELNLDDAPDRPAALDGPDRDRDLVPDFEALLGPSPVLHVRRIARFHDPPYGLPVFTFDLELQEGVRVGPDPFGDGAFQHEPFGRVVLERGSSMMRGRRTRSDEQTRNQSEQRDERFPHRNLHYFHASIAFLISDPAGCSLISILIASGAVTFDSFDPLFSLGRTSATVVPARRNCITLACASSEYRPMCVNPAGLPLAGAISMNVSRLT